MRTLRVAMRVPAGAARSANTEVLPAAGAATAALPGRPPDPGCAGAPVTGELPDVGSTRSFSWQAVSPAQVTNENIAKLFR